MKHLAKTMRSNATDAERVLWNRLRAHRLDGFKFKRQVVIEPYIVDFVCLERKLVVEADGGQHAEEVGQDEKRTAFLKACGYKVLRFWNNQILQETEAVMEAICRELLSTADTSDKGPE